MEGNGINRTERNAGGGGESDNNGIRRGAAGTVVFTTELKPSGGGRERGVVFSPDANSRVAKEGGRIGKQFASGDGCEGRLIDTSGVIK